MAQGIDPYTRRLPVYVLMDCSSSMKGDAIESVHQGLRNLISRLSSDPHTSDIVWISVIAFDSTPRQLIPLCNLLNIKGLPSKVGGSSNLGRALLFLDVCMKKEVRKHTLKHRSDWKPLVLLMSDGKPTDEWKIAAEILRKEVNFIACGVGSEVNINSLKQLSDVVVLIKDQTPESYNQLINFLGSTMKVASQRSAESSETIVPNEKTKYTKIVFS